MKSRLLARLSGHIPPPVDDLRRLLAIRLGDAPVRPDLGLPVQPAWSPDAGSRRELQEAIARTLRGGEPRLAEVRVAAAGDDAVFTVHARSADGSALDATARIEGGRLGIAP